MQRYDSYKDSGVKWLGEIPSHWKICKSKYLWKENISLSENGYEELLSVSQYDGVTPAKGDSRSESLKGYKIVSENDLVINIMLAWLGGLGVSKYNGIVSPAYCVYKMTGDANPRFLHFLYKTPLYLAEFARHSTGVVPSRWRMYTDDFGQVLTLLPPIEEQEAIANYLDSATSKIDEAIAQQQKMIDLLNERKQIIINQVVTKGLNPNVPMRDSGVDWIGEIPTHWKILRNKYLFKESDERNISLKYPLLSFSKIKGIVPQSEISDRGASSEDLSKYKVLHVGQLLENRLQAWNGMFGTSAIEGCVSPDYSVFNVKESIINVEYVSFLFRTPLYVMQWSNASKGIGTGFNRLYTPQFNSILCVCPPLNEQVEIVKYVKSKTNKLILAINKIQKTISLLQERKQIIINDVVTGKIKVI